MQYDIGDLSVVPVRKEPSDKSEMVTQLLFGETFRITENKKKWLKITITQDDYVGWIDEKQFLPITDKYFHELKKSKVAYSLDLVQSATSDKRHVPILIGSTLPNFDGINFQLHKEKMIYNGQALVPENNSYNGNLILKVAMKYLNAPYLWGGRSPFGIDCSGFTQVVFKILGIFLKRDAYQQAEMGSTVNFVEETQDGDLAFFENEERKISHVGIVIKDTPTEKLTLENNKNRHIIHASGKIRIDQLDHYGIFNLNRKKYSHKLRIIKRIL